MTVCLSVTLKPECKNVLFIRSVSAFPCIVAVGFLLFKLKITLVFRESQAFWLNREGILQCQQGTIRGEHWISLLQGCSLCLERRGTETRPSWRRGKHYTLLKLRKDIGRDHLRLKKVVQTDMNFYQFHKDSWFRWTSCITTSRVVLHTVVVVMWMTRFRSKGSLHFDHFKFCCKEHPELGQTCWLELMKGKWEWWEAEGQMKWFEHALND